MKGFDNKTTIKIWGITNVGQSMLLTLASVYFSFFLTDVVLMPLSLVAFIMVFTSTFDFVIAPIAGAFIDMTKPMRWGKIRSWLIVSAPITVLFWTLSYASFESKIITLVFILGGYVIGKGAYNIHYAADLTMISLISDDPILRTKLVSQRMIGFNIGKLLIGYIAPVVIAYSTMMLSQKAAYPIIMGIGGIVFLIANYIQFKLTEGVEDVNVETKGEAKKQQVGFKDTIGMLIKNPQLLVIVLIDLSSNLGSFLLPALAVYYYKYVAHDNNLLALHLLLIGFGGLIGSTFVRLYGAKIKSQKKFLLVIYPIMAITLFACRFVAYTPIYFLVLNILLSIFAGTTQPLELNLYLDNATYVRWKTNVDSTNVITGMSGLSSKLATWLKSILIPIVLASAGYIAGAEPTPELKKALIDAYTIIPSIIPVTGFIFLKFFHTLSTEKIEKMKEEIKERELLAK